MAGILFSWLRRLALVLAGLTVAICGLILLRSPYLFAPDLEPSRKPTVAALCGLYQMPGESFELTADEEPSYLMLRKNGTFGMRGVPAFFFHSGGEKRSWVLARNNLSGTWDIRWDEDLPYRKCFVELRATQVNDRKGVWWYTYHLYVQGNSAPYDIHCFSGEKDEEKKWVFRRLLSASSKSEGGR